jgi:hypothetical protein
MRTQTEYNVIDFAGRKQLKDLLNEHCAKGWKLKDITYEVLRPGSARGVIILEREIDVTL